MVETFREPYADSWACCSGRYAYSAMIPDRYGAIGQRHQRHRPGRADAAKTPDCWPATGVSDGFTLSSGPRGWPRRSCTSGDDGRVALLAWPRS